MSVTFWGLVALAVSAAGVSPLRRNPSPAAKTASATGRQSRNQDAGDKITSGTNSLRTGKTKSSLPEGSA